MPHEVKSIHYLRGLAALLVVFHHSIIQLAPVRDHYAHVEFGQAGVDIFFVISGFVIYLSNAKGRLGSGEFLKRRIIRIVPLYWLATLAVVAVAVVAPRFFATTTLTAQDVAQSLLFVPAYSAAFPGQIWPVLVPGWSLNYEMFFYRRVRGWSLGRARTSSALSRRDTWDSRCGRPAARPSASRP